MEGKTFSHRVSREDGFINMDETDIPLVARIGCGGFLAGWIPARPLGRWWHEVGRICGSLAERSRDELGTAGHLGAVAYRANGGYL
mgnify:CR=1 FL=1